jgi:ferrochelatase
LLHGVILSIRPQRSAKLYRRVWGENGSPLLYYTRRLAEGLASWAAEQGRASIQIAVGMRYGSPSIPAALQALRQAGIEKLVALPLFPQYSGSTTGSIYDAVTAELRAWRNIPDLHFISGYHNHPAYLDALAGSIRRAWQTRQPPRKLLFSFHGIPRSYAEKGDPYHQQCLETAERLAERLGLGTEGWQAAFQSRFGPQEWLKPYTHETLQALGSEGIEGLDVVCPGFAVDCLETIDEIGHEGRRTFEAAGGKSFNYLPALNDSPGHVQALGGMLKAYF